MNLRKIIVILFCTLTFIPSAFADDWVLGAKQFTFTKQTSLSSTQVGLEKVIPALMLEQISVGSKHLPGEEELYFRQRQSLKTNRTSLFLQLSKEVQKRDSLVLSYSDSKKIKKEIAACEENIKEIQKKIDDNLKEQDEINQKKIDDEALNENQNDLIFLSQENKSPKKENIVLSESVVLYKNSYDTLVNISSSATSSEIERTCRAEKINGLLSGKITSYGDYILVNVEIRTYPGGTLLGQATDIGTIRGVKKIASNLVQDLMPKIANALPVELFFDIIPYTKKNELSLSLDGVVYNPCPEKITVEAGLHTLEFDSPTSNKISLSYDFSDSSAFYISLPLTDKSQGAFNLYLKNQVEGSFYSNGQLTGNTDENYFASLKVNGQSVLGQFISKEKRKVLKEKKVTLEDGSESTELVEEDGEPYSTFFFIPQSLMVENDSLMVDVKVQDLNEIINRRRIWMYRGYSAFVISVPVMMLSNGIATSVINAYNSGNEERGAAVFWNTAKYISIGTTVASSAFFIFELVRYLNAANQVLPVNAYSVEESDIPHFEKPVAEESQITEENVNAGENEKTANPEGENLFENSGEKMESENKSEKSN